MAASISKSNVAQLKKQLLKKNKIVEERSNNKNKISSAPKNARQASTSKKQKSLTNPNSPTSTHSTANPRSPRSKKPERSTRSQSDPFHGIERIDYDTRLISKTLSPNGGVGRDAAEVIEHLMVCMGKRVAHVIYHVLLGIHSSGLDEDHAYRIEPKYVDIILGLCFPNRRETNDATLKTTIESLYSNFERDYDDYTEQLVSKHKKNQTSPKTNSKTSQRKSSPKASSSSPTSPPKNHPISLSRRFDLKLRSTVVKNNIFEPAFGVYGIRFAISKKFIIGLTLIFEQLMTKILDLAFQDAHNEKRPRVRIIRKNITNAINNDAELSYIFYDCEW